MSDTFSHATSQDRVTRSLQLAHSEAAQHVFTHVFDEQALAQARAADAARQAGKPLGALHGLPITLKDNYDMAGQTTMAGTVVCEGEPAAAQDAVSVARLRQAGAVIVGKTNMSEFAFSGVGINPHYGTPRNPCDAKVARVPGGSSSGAAVSVALGLAVAGLGSDTGGSIRIPAALCGVVGFKSTQSRIPLQGVMELSRTLDTVGAITRNVRDSLVVEGVLSQQPLLADAADLRGVRFAVPQTLFLDELDPEVALAFARALTRISAAGAQLVELPLSALSEIAARSQPGGFSPVEGFAAHHARLARAPDRIDPRVAFRMAQGKGVSALDYLELHNRRHEWISHMEAELQGFDAMLSPTVALVAPELAPLLVDDVAFFNTNRLLLRNPAAINYLNGCAFSLPCQVAGELPVGLMVSSLRGHDARLAAIALALEPLLIAP
ncbi:amidase [Limnohabitans sp. B9-3]|uniref:amidase n=1 Tax=Limnohabitans sp. B9-3 TaxID=1100707 RepID=UPI000C1E7069|nr:amidase [Limnohabitans sp. B9-3]PIT77651.1 amidase [Limnohabitans sp. B9-3]